MYYDIVASVINTTASWDYDEATLPKVWTDSKVTYDADLITEIASFSLTCERKLTDIQKQSQNFKRLKPKLISIDYKCDLSFGDDAADAIGAIAAASIDPNTLIIEQGVKKVTITNMYAEDDGQKTSFGEYAPMDYDVSLVSQDSVPTVAAI
jgi:hypothetical protein